MDNIKNLIPLDENIITVTDSIIQENNPDKIKELTHLFNLNQVKKNTLRLNKLNNVLDIITDKIADRINQHSDTFTNKDLLDYLQVVQNTIDKANKSINMLDDTPTIVLNQVNIGDTLNRESRQKIAEAVKNILNQQDIEDKDGELIELDFSEDKLKEEEDE